LRFLIVLAGTGSCFYESEFFSPPEESRWKLGRRFEIMKLVLKDALLANED
jgi:hypothetical protein